MYHYLITQAAGFALLAASLLFLLAQFGFWKWLRAKAGERRRNTLAFSILAGLGLVLVAVGGQHYKLHFAMPPNMHSEAPDKNPPILPVPNMLDFLANSSRFGRVDDIGADPGNLPAPLMRTENELVRIHMTVREVISEVAEGIYNNYWTYDGQVPGPMLRVREGDTVELSLTNDSTSLHEHNIDLHAVTGPGGGADATKVNPGETKTFRWKALQPGLYIYHCATSNLSVHNSHGQYGLILVEPEGGMPKVDREFYIVQGELYTRGGIGNKGLQIFDSRALLDGIPTYVTFNGRIETTPRMKVRKGDRVRIYAGNGGVNLISSFHLIGEIFDTVYPEGAMGEGSAIFRNVQTTSILPGGTAIVEFRADVPGKFMLVDHALSRMNKGAWAFIEVEGDPSPDIFQPLGDANRTPEKMEHGMEH